MYLNPFATNVLPGIEDRRSNQELVAIIQLRDQGLLPSQFPVQLWATQATRYKRYWAWFRGDVLNEESGTLPDGRPIYRYPLKINPVRNFARKHTALLFGEVPDTPRPLVQHVVSPKRLLHTSSIPDKDRDTAKFLERYLNEVWQGSYGRSIQYQNGILSQFLGGSVFQTQYVPWRKDLLVPLIHKPVFPDFFMPIWGDDWWNLLEAYVVYRVPSQAVQLQYGIDVGDTPFVIYAEHWNKKEYSVWVNGKPLTANYSGYKVTYDKLENPFGLVPFTYIPRWREGNFYGSSFVEDIDGLVLEYNARFADLGDGIRKNINRIYVGRNIQSQPRQKTFGDSQAYTDLGQAIPGSNHEPEMEAIDAPEWSESFTEVNRDLWKQLGREVGLGPIAFGEDEGSQRSALTLAFRMWPSTVGARAQRVFWTDGLRHMGNNVLRMSAQLGLKVGGQTISDAMITDFDQSVDWLPMIPRDREAQVNEIILRLQANAIDLPNALEQFGDIPDVQEAIKGIQDFAQFQASIQASAKPGTTPGSGAPSATVKPILTDHLKE